MEALKELMAFVVKRKKFWLLPAIIVHLLLAVVFMVTGGSALAPFIYTVF